MRQALGGLDSLTEDSSKPKAGKKPTLAISLRRSSRVCTQTKDTLYSDPSLWQLLSSLYLPVFVLLTYFTS